MRLLRTSEAAALLGIAPATLKNWANADVIPCHRTAGGHRQFAEAALLEWRRSRQDDQDARVSA